MIPTDGILMARIVSQIKLWNIFIFTTHTHTHKKNVLLLRYIKKISYFLKSQIINLKHSINIVCKNIIILDSLKIVLKHSVFKKHNRNIRKKKKKKRNISFWLSKHPIYRNRQRKKKKYVLRVLHWHWSAFIGAIN